jgi:crossover junction endodeoxyribonuclease RuvC
MRITAFDPGREASWARFDTEKPWSIEIGILNKIGSGRLLRPCPINLSEVIEDSDQVVVEEVGARNNQGVSSMFTFGLCVGTILGSISAHKKPVVLVTPTKWKSASRLGGISDDKVKDAARAYAIELWPEHEKILKIKKNHGMAEAALMARWYFLKGPGRDIPLEDSPMRATA